MASPTQSRATSSLDVNKLVRVTSAGSYHLGYQIPAKAEGIHGSALSVVVTKRSNLTRVYASEVHVTDHRAETCALRIAAHGIWGYGRTLFVGGTLTS